MTKCDNELLERSKDRSGLLSVCDTIETLDINFGRLTVKDLRIIMYLGGVSDSVNNLVDLGLEDKNQEMLYRSNSLEKISQELGVERRKFYYTGRKLQSWGVVRKSEYKYNEKMVFLELTEKGRKVYEAFVGLKSQ